jgi:Flp pilus assembly pilin Flp
MRLIQQTGPSEEKGSAIVEYALLLVLIAFVCLLALDVLGGSASSAFSEAASSVASS